VSVSFILVEGETLPNCHLVLFSYSHAKTLPNIVKIPFLGKEKCRDFPQFH
jgi:hypothetical protein